MSHELRLSLLADTLNRSLVVVTSRSNCALIVMDGSATPNKVLLMTHHSVLITGSICLIG